MDELSYIDIPLSDISCILPISILLNNNHIQLNNPKDKSRNNLVSSPGMSLIVIKISLGTIQSKFVSTDCDEDKSKSVSYKQKKSYELKFYLQTGFRHPCRVQTSLVGIVPYWNPCGIKCQHAHLYQELSLHETGFRNGFYRIETIFVFLTVLIQYVFNLILHIYPTLL